MTLNRSKIEWTDFTWNPVTGCRHGCNYCYARRFAKRFGKTEDERNFNPVFHEDRLRDPLNRKKPAKIFVCSVSDLFGAWVPDRWIERVLSIAKNANQHIYQFLTKNPSRYVHLNFRSNMWLGATVTDQKSLDSIPLGFVELNHRIFLSVEPMLGPVSLFNRITPDWLIIGAMTGPKKRPPKKAWVQALIDEARFMGVPIFLKSNLGWHEQIMEYP